MEGMGKRLGIFAFVSILACIHLIFANENAGEEHRRFEYKYSFKGPHLMQADHTIPFWTLMGDTVAGDNQVRLVPSIRDKKGLVWSNHPFPYDSWEIEVHIRIEGRGRVGADGLAIWYVSHTPELGPVYGSKDYFQGVGIFLDSFDNNNQNDNPVIMIVTNDGRTEYHHASDGVNQNSGSCFQDFRNRPYPVKLKIKYSNGLITVSYDPGNLEDGDYEVCASANINLPPNYYFGVSAATGGLADDHDVIKFLTWSISDKKLTPEEEQIQEEERKKLQEDYDKNVEDFNKMQEEYKKQHPDAAQDMKNPEELYEGAASTELRSIFDVQNSIKKDIRQISISLDQVLEQQSFMFRSLESLDTKVKQGGGDGSQQPHIPAAGADDSAKKYHIDNVLNMQRESYDSIKQLRETLINLQHVVNNMDLRVQQGIERKPNQGGGTDSYETIQYRQAMNEKMHDLQNDIASLLRRPVANPPKLHCPEPEMPSCISFGVFLAIAAAQVIILLIYHSMRASREDAAKKFF
ncbi:protein ERGIC-53-like [Styela clava]